MATRFDWIFFKEIGIKLKDNPFEDHKEACYRTSIGRIYYSIFLIIRDKLYSMNKRGEIRQAQGLGEHEKIITYLQMQRDNTQLKLANLLKKLKDLRVNCDYHIDPNIENSHVDSALILFESIKNILANDLGWVTVE